MEHSKNYKKWKNYYDKGILAKWKLYNLVGLRLGITAEEYEEITGEPYVPPVVDDSE